MSPYELPALDDGQSEHCSCCGHRRGQGCGGPNCDCRREAYITAIVAMAPPLTPQQQIMLKTLLTNPPRRKNP